MTSTNPRTRAFPAVALAFVACAREEPVPHEIEVRVATINLRHDVDWWTERFPLIADEIVRLDPQVIGMEEVEIAADQSEALSAMITARGGRAYRVHQELKAGLAALAGEGIATFSAFPIRTSSTIELGCGGRVATLDRIELEPGATLDVYNTHLHHEGGDDVRRPQAERIVAFARGMSAGAAAVLTGDMNAREDSATIGALRDAGWVDTFRTVHGDRTPSIGNTVPVHLSKTPVAQRQTQRIDYVFAQGLTPRTSTVAFRNARPDGLYPSDHLGVMTTLVISVP